MPRQPRSFPPGSTLHIISRGNRRQRIFESEPDWGRFKGSMLSELEREAIILLAFCLMPNHIHLVAICDCEALSSAMHRILTSHAAYMNKRYGRTGHLFEDRFKSYPCAPEGLKPLVRYVHQNPVRARLARSADDWAWSSHRDYIDPSCETPAGKFLVLSQFGAEPAQAIACYQEYMRTEDAGSTPEDSPLVPLEALCAKVEREAGHVAGLIKLRSKRRDITGARKRFIGIALNAGHRSCDVAKFLGLAPSAIYRYRPEV